MIQKGGLNVFLSCYVLLLDGTLGECAITLGDKFADSDVGRIGADCRFRVIRDWRLYCLIYISWRSKGDMSSDTHIYNTIINRRLIVTKTAVLQHTGWTRPIVV